MGNLLVLKVFSPATTSVWSRLQYGQKCFAEPGRDDSFQDRGVKTQLARQCRHGRR